MPPLAPAFAPKTKGPRLASPTGIAEKKKNLVPRLSRSRDGWSKFSVGGLGRRGKVFFSCFGFFGGTLRLSAGEEEEIFVCLPLPPLALLPIIGWHLSVRSPPPGLVVLYCFVHYYAGCSSGFTHWSKVSLGKFTKKNYSGYNSSYLHSIHLVIPSPRRLGRRLDRKGGLVQCTRGEGALVRICLVSETWTLDERLGTKHPRGLSISQAASPPSRKIKAKD